MILFKPEHVDMILSGRKTQTRRTGRSRWRINSVHQCRTRMLDKASTFAKVQVLDRYVEGVGGISKRDAHAEGYDSPAEFVAAFNRINHVDVKVGSRAMGVWVVRFQLTTCPSCDSKTILSGHPPAHFPLVVADCQDEWHVEIAA